MSSGFGVGGAGEGSAIAGVAGGGGREISGVESIGGGRERACIGRAFDVSDCPRMSKSASRDGGGRIRGGTRGEGGGDDGIELRDELGALPIISFACINSNSSRWKGRNKKGGVLATLHRQAASLQAAASCYIFVISL